MTFDIAEKDVTISPFEIKQPYPQLESFVPEAVSRFRRALRSYAVFNLVFCLLILIEVLYLFFHLTFLMQTFVLAIHLSLIFVTVFSYVTLRLYFQAKKAELCFTLKDELVQILKKDISDSQNPEGHRILAKLYCQFAAQLHGKEYKLYQPPIFLEGLSSSFEKMSCWFHWQDMHFMKELLLKSAVEEHLKVVKLDPISLEVHAGLANSYVLLSGLYVDPRTIEGMDHDRWIPPHKYTEAFKKRFRAAAERAIEEFKILRDYAPEDPWVHAQLAYSYRDLQMPMEEIKEYETIHQLCPADKETLFKLGKLYFEQGMNAKGLQVYETLKKANYKKAEVLIQLYGTYVW